MTARALRCEPSDLHALEQQMTDDLRTGGCFVHGAMSWQPTEPCGLLIDHPCDGAILPLSARVVWVSIDAPRTGVGLTLEGFGEMLRKRRGRFVTEHASAGQPGLPATPAATPDRTHGAPLAERSCGLKWSGRDANVMGAGGSTPPRNSSSVWRSA